MAKETWRAEIIAKLRTDQRLIAIQLLSPAIETKESALDVLKNGGLIDRLYN